MAVRAVSMLALGLVVVAGCLGAPAARSPAAAQGPAIDLAAYRDCPVVNGTTWPCEPSGDDPTFVEVEARPPLGWRCMSFADQRFDEPPDRRYPFPSWYTFFGPAVGGDRAAGEFQLGIKYDSLNDTDGVLGVAVVLSEDESLRYVWHGPPAGFVRLPVAINDPAVLVLGILYPQPGPTRGLHDDSENTTLLPDAVHRIEGAPAEQSWSRGPWTKPASDDWVTMGTTWQWNLVQSVPHAGERLHVAAHRDEAMGWDDPRQAQGAQHWGQWRTGPWNATIPGVHDSSLTPYMEFYFESKNIFDATVAGAMDFLCRCPDQPLLSYEGIWCALGTTPPILERGVVRAAVVP